MKTALVIIESDGRDGLVYVYETKEQAERALRDWFKKYLNGEDEDDEWTEAYYGPKPDPDTCDLWRITDHYAERNQKDGCIFFTPVLDGDVDMIRLYERKVW